MEEVDNGCLVMRMGVSGRMFLLVPATRVVLDQRLLNGCFCVCCYMCSHSTFTFVYALSHMRTGNYEFAYYLFKL